MQLHNIQLGIPFIENFKIKLCINSAQLELICLINVSKYLISFFSSIG